ncbi:MAG: hypothetical protein ACNFW9_05800 [Candidatus Kerfeldbacteria bacterium]
MKKKLLTLVVVVASIALTAGIVNAATSHNVTSQFGPEGDIFQVDGTMNMRSVMIGEQGVGGVTYFNGSIINATTNSGVDNPVTFGDNVRIDGRVFRGATAGTGDTQPFIVNDNMEVTGSLTVASLLGTGIVTSDNITDATIATADIADSVITTAKIDDDAITSAKITDGTIVSGDLASNSIISSKITDGTIATADVADDAITPDKINGTGGANLPIAYGYCNSDGSDRGGTSNIACSWDGGSNQYEITITGVTYSYLTHVAVVTPINSGFIPATNSVNDHFTVDFVDESTGSAGQTSFSFIIYEM